MAEFDVANLVHGYIVNSTIAKGAITEIDTAKAMDVQGVRGIFTHYNIPESLGANSDYSNPSAPPGNPFRPLYSNEILYNGQRIALVVARHI